MHINQMIIVHILIIYINLCKCQNKIISNVDIKSICNVFILFDCCHCNWQQYKGSKPESIQSGHIINIVRQLLQSWSRNREIITYINTRNDNMIKGRGGKILITRH